MTCPHCGGVLPTPRKAKTNDALATPHLDPTSDAARYAAYKRTAPLEDTRFWIHHANLTPELRAGFLVLEASILTLKSLPRADVYRQLHALQDAWRHDAEVRYLTWKRDADNLTTEVA